MKLATEFVRQNRDVLREKPVWLFSSGPLGSKASDDQGRDLLVECEPREIAEFRQAVHPRDHRVFFGALAANKLGFFHRLLFHLPANRDHKLFQQGDFRQWILIGAWADQIAQDLKRAGRDAQPEHHDAVLAWLSSGKASTTLHQANTSLRLSRARA